MHYLSDIVF